MGTLNEDLTAIKSVEDILTSNKVARFAYTENAYNNNDADGVDDYNVDNEQNIPNGTASIMKVNQTVINKGYRAQASSITRMLMNHFLGRLSYNVNKVNDNMSSLLSTLQSHLGTSNGVATLDVDGRVPYSQLPESAMEYKGTWNASTNTPTLADGTGNTGDMYMVSVEGTFDFGSGDITLYEGDSVVYNGSVWQRVAGGKEAQHAETADTATKLANARTITIAGDATGSTTFDGSADKTITLSVEKAGTSRKANVHVSLRHGNTLFAKTWTDITDVNGSYVWTDGDNIYHSKGIKHYVLNKTTSTWTAKTWAGLTDFNVNYVWTDGDNIYHNNGTSQYVLNKTTSTWTVKTWAGLTGFNGDNVWTDGDNIYNSNGTTQAVLPATRHNYVDDDKYNSLFGIVTKSNCSTLSNRFVFGNV